MRSQVLVMDYDNDTGYLDDEPAYIAPRPPSRITPLRIIVAGGVALFLLIAIFALFNASPKKDNSIPAITTTIVGKWNLSDNSAVNFVKNGIVFREPPPGKDSPFENKSGRWDVYEDILTIQWDGVIFKGRDVYKINGLTDDQLELEHLQNGTVLTGARIH